jgi:predicted lipid-binding transport protein (Tim44 family)
MKKRGWKILAVVGGLTALIALAVAPDALASAGGGSSGFGGGGEGGGGGGGHGSFIVFYILFQIARLGHGLGILIIIAGVVLYFVFTRGTQFWRAQERTGPKQSTKTSQRARRVELAAAEAAEDDQTFAPEVVKVQAAALFKDIQQAWSNGDRARLNALVGRDLMAEWTRRLDDYDRKGWRNHVEVLGEPNVQYVGLVNRGGTDEDRVTVKIEAKVKDYVVDRAGNHMKHTGRFSETVNLREFWTLRRRSGRWILMSIEQGSEGAHALTDQIVANEWSDDQGLQDKSLTELANQQALPADVKPAEVADLDFEGDARAAALDLSLQDARFGPDILEIAARRATQAWADAIDGDDRSLSRLATKAAIGDLLHPGDPSARTRVIVRGLSIKNIRITHLDAAADPPTMSLEVQFEGRRWIEDRQTEGVVSGNPTRRAKFAEHWTLALSGDDAQPWRIVAVDSPLAAA